MNFVKTRKFNDVAVNCYKEDDDVWLTGEDIGRMLGYEYPADSIEIIHQTHKNRLDKYSKIRPFTSNTGGTKNVTFYNFKGLLEICRWATSQKQANDIWDYVVNILTGGNHHE